MSSVRLVSIQLVKNLPASNNGQQNSEFISSRAKKIPRILCVMENAVQMQCINT